MFLMMFNLLLNICWEYFVVYGSIGEKIVVIFKKRVSNKPAPALSDDLRFNESTDKDFVPVIT